MSHIDTNFTTREVCGWLKHPDGTPFEAPLRLLQQLGKDCSLCARLRNAQWTVRITPDMPWPQERAYPREIIQEVFRLNPVTRPFVEAMEKTAQ